MKIKLFIVTYNNQARLNKTLASIVYNNNVPLEMFIINNHSNFSIDSYFNKHIKHIYHNDLRPDFSTGHLAQNWNQAIINGFSSLTSPDCDLLITSQDDVDFNTNWLRKILNYTRKFNFLQAGRGDEVCVYKAEAVKNIGLWDERFCNIAYQEADYFLRAISWEKRASINDYFHKRLYNSVEHGICIDREAPHFNAAHKKSAIYHDYSYAVFVAKYGENVKSQEWENLNLPIKPLISSFVLYPYFEKDVATLKEQDYILPVTRPGFFLPSKKIKL